MVKDRHDISTGNQVIRPGSRFFSLLAAASIVLGAAVVFCLNFFPPTVHFDLATKAVTTIDVANLHAPVPYFSWSVVIIAFILAWLLPFPRRLHTGQVKLENGNTDEAAALLSSAVQRSILLRRSLAFLPVFVFLPVFCAADALFRSPTLFLSSWLLLCFVGVRFTRAHPRDPLSGHMIVAWIGQRSAGQLWGLAVVVSLFFFILLGWRYHASLIGLEGDEPEYVMVAHSIIHDGDIMVRDNYERREYRHFLQQPLPFGRTTWEGYPVEGIFLSCYLLPWYWLSTVIDVDTVLLLRLAVTPLAALLVGELFLLMGIFSSDRRMCFLLSLLCGLTVPLYFYSPLVFSEISGALLLSIALRSLFRRHGSDLRFLLAGLVIVLLFWNGAKYVVLGVPLLLLFLAVVANEFRGRLTAKQSFGLLIVALVLTFVLLGTHFAYLKHYYNSFSPLATRGGELLDFTKDEQKGLMSSLSWLFSDRISRMGNSFRVAIGYLFDQKVGLLVFSPFYLLAFHGLLVLVRRRNILEMSIPLLLGGYWFMLFWLSYWEGHGAPARYLVPLIPLLAVLLSMCPWEHPLRRRMLAMLAFPALFVGLTGFQAPWLMFHHTLWRFSEEMNKLLLTASGSDLPLTAMLPSFTSPDLGWLSCGVLLMLSLLVLALFHFPDNRLAAPMVRGLIVVMLLSPIFLTGIIVLDSLPLDVEPPDDSVTLPEYIIGKSTIGTYQWEQDGFWIQGRRTGRMYASSSAMVSPGLTNDIHSLVDNRIVVHTPRRRVILEIPANMTRRIHWQGLQRRTIHGVSWHILEIQPQQSQNLFVSGLGDDGRNLGCFVAFPRMEARDRENSPDTPALD